MSNNDTIKLICKALKIDHTQLLEVFRVMDPEIGPEDVADLMKNEDEPGFIYCSNEGLALFLDGLIGVRRGKSGDTPKPQTEMSNNTVLKKLRIALELQDDMTREIFLLGGRELSRSELTPFFRKEGHRNYRRCSDKMLREFLQGLTIKMNEA